MQDTQDVDKDYDEFLNLLARRIKSLRLERNLSLRDMVVTHGYHDSNYRRIEREGAGGIQSLLRICKAFDVSLAYLLDGLGEYPKDDIQGIGTKVATEEKISRAKSRSAKTA
jgi:transcriptional regulator with XRE-family HTH domain